MKTIHSLVVALLLTIFVDAQTETVVNAAGATVVEVISIDPLGNPTTRILQTIATSTASQTDALTTATITNPLLQQTTAALTTTTQVQVGPVGQPGTTPVTPGGPTPYEYTTTDGNGNQVVMQGVFTPTGPQSALPAQTTTGTILDYSQWLSSIGTHTARVNTACRMSMPVATGWYYFVASAIAGLVGGAWLIAL